jgi:hypothetical protein
MRHLNHITAEHLTVGQEALVVASLVKGRGLVRANRANRLRAHQAWSPCYRPAFAGSEARPMARPSTRVTMPRSQAVSMATALKRQPAAAGGQGLPQDTRLALPLRGSLSAGLASSCPAGCR